MARKTIGPFELKYDDVLKLLARMLEEERELEILLFIGSQRYEIKVLKKADLSPTFLKIPQNNRLNPKYKASIKRLVKDKLTEEEEKLHKNSIQTRVKQPQPPVAINHGEVIKPKKIAKYQSVNNKIKSISLFKIQQQIESINSENPPQSCKIYEEWKQKQKNEKNKEIRAEKLSQEKSKVTKNHEKHSPDYFYKKLLQFQSEIEQKCETNFIIMNIGLYTNKYMDDSYLQATNVVINKVIQEYFIPGKISILLPD